MDQLEELEYTILLNCKKNYKSISEYGYLANIYTSVQESPEALKRLWRIIDEMGRHSDPLIKVILLMQLPKLALVGGVKDRTYCTQWRLVLEYLVDEDERIRKSSQLVFLFFMMKKLLDEDVVKNYFCPAVSQACAISADTIDLMCQMTPFVGKELTEKYFLQRFIDLCTHENSVIRKSCARNFCVMCTAVGCKISDKLLLPIFIKLCRDPSVHVRSACIDVFVLVASISRMKKKRNELTSAFYSLLQDTNDSCRSSAYRILGAFICTFAEHALFKLLANDRFYTEYELCPEVVGSKSSHLELLKTDSPSNVFSRAHVEALFPSLSYSSVNNKGGGEDFRSPFGIFFPIFDDCEQLDEKPGKLSSSESKHSLLEGPAMGLQNEEECNMEVAEELDEFNSFRFWQIPPLEIDFLQEAEGEMGEVEPYEKIWTNTESLGDSHECNMEIQELPGPVLLNATSPGPDSDRDNTQELIDTVQRCMSFIYTSDSESPALCDTIKPEIIKQLERLPTLSQDVVPEILLEHYISMAYPQNKKNKIIHEEKAQFCASWLPAVALTLGPSNWPRIRGTHKCLSLNFNLKVRKTIAASMHELAAILGEKIATMDLVPVFEDIAADSDDVAICALQHLAEFFQYLVPEKRLILLSHISEIMRNCFVSSWNWRCREAIAEQLRLSIKLFTPSDCFTHFVPLAMNLLCYRVASVRHKAVELMSDLIFNLREESNFQSCIVSKLLEEFASHLSWRRRQMYVLLCAHIANNRVLDSEIFSNLFLEDLLKLSKDMVPNVVLCTARCLSVSIINSQYITGGSPYFRDIMIVLQELERDKDRDLEENFSALDSTKLGNRGLQMIFVDEIYRWNMYYKVF